MASLRDRLFALLGIRPSAKVLVILNTSRGQVAVPMSRRELRRLL